MRTPKSAPRWIGETHTFAAIAELCRPSPIGQHSTTSCRRLLFNCCRHTKTTIEASWERREGAVPFAKQQSRKVITKPPKRNRQTLSITRREMTEGAKVCAARQITKHRPAKRNSRSRSPMNEEYCEDTRRCLSRASNSDHETAPWTALIRALASLAIRGSPTRGVSRVRLTSRLRPQNAECTTLDDGDAADQIFVTTAREGGTFAQTGLPSLTSC